MVVKQLISSERMPEENESPEGRSEAAVDCKAAKVSGEAISQEMNDGSNPEKETEVSRRLVIRLLFDGVVGDEETVKQGDCCGEDHREDVFCEVQVEKAGSQEQVQLGED